MRSLRVLFISRAFPPIIGGIEKQNAAIYNALKQETDVKLIVNRYGKCFLPFFLPYSILYALCFAKRYDLVLLGDGVLSIIAWTMRLINRSPLVFCTLHGLDITFSNVFYQKWWVQKFFPAVDIMLPVSRRTAMEAVSRGVRANRCRVIPNGVNVEFFSQRDNKDNIDKLQQLLSINVQNKLILLTVGRLVKRKGVHWFVENVLPRLTNNIVYVVVGDGPMRKKVEEAVSKNKLGPRVHLLGQVSSEYLRTIYAGADIFIQPNIPVENDMEGFGLVVLEAGASGLPVIASKLEGLTDAISHGNNGLLLTSGDVGAYAAKIQYLAQNTSDRQDMGRRARDYVRRKFSWEVVAKCYIKVFNEYIGNSEGRPVSKK